jgi:hypothetical protein
MRTMNTPIKLVIAVVLLVTPIVPFEHGAVAQQPPLPVVVYYSGFRGLYRFLVDAEAVELVHPAEENGYLLSHNGQHVAFGANGQVFLSQLATWDPQSILPDTLNALNYSWTLDDTRIIIKTGTQVMSPGATSNDWETYAYDLRTNQLESWPWGNCKKIGRHRETRHIALICWADEWMTSPEVPVIALEWGGEYQGFNESEYEILVESLEMYPYSFEWNLVDDQEQFVFVREVAPAQYAIYRARDGNPDERIIATNDLRANIAISPDGDLIAYMIDCTYRGPRSCLQIVEMNTGEVVWHSRDTFWVEWALDIEWFPDGSRIALSAHNYNPPDLGASIWIFNVATGYSERYSEEVIGDGGIGSIVVVE